MKGGENLSKKKKTRSGQPKSSVMILGKSDFPATFFPNGYIPLSQNPEVKIAVSKIADLVSNMTVHLMENSSKGDVRVKNELSRKLDINPCKGMTRKNWLYRIATDLLLNGDGNSIIIPTIKDGLIDNLVPLPMRSVSFDYDLHSLTSYKVNYNNHSYNSDEIVHFSINPDDVYPWLGTGYRVALRDLVNNLKQATSTKNSFMSGQYMPNVVIKVDALNEELANEAGRDQIKKKYLGESKPGEPWVIPAELLEVQQIKPLSLKDIAINESVELDKKTVAGLIGVPAFFVGVGAFNKEEYNNFVDTRIMSIAQTIAQTLTRDLLYSPTLYFKLNPRSLYAYNLTDLVNAGTSMLDRNAMRRNELRDWVGLDPDEEMEELLVLENYIPASQSGEQNKLKGGDES